MSGSIIALCPGQGSQKVGMGKAWYEASAAARRAPRSHAPTAEEEAAHEAFLRRLEDPVWRN